MHAKAPICDTRWAAVFVAKVFKTCKLHEVYGAKLSKWRANRVENLGLLSIDVVSQEVVCHNAGNAGNDGKSDGARNIRDALCTVAVESELDSN